MSFCVQFGNQATRVLDESGHALRIHLQAPHLGGCAGESWPLAVGSRPAPALRWQRQGNWHVGQAGDLLWVCALGNAADAVLEATTGSLYGELFTLLGQQWQLQRIWHYLPRINEPGAEGLERYRAFCRGRSLAFETAFGSGFQSRLPAASAVGCDGDTFVIYACARRNTEVRYFENPLQVPAYRYPQTYGPRAPGFARASLTQPAETQGLAETPLQNSAGAARAASPYREIYISGTASIRAERSELGGGVLGQLATTVENLNRIALECGVPDLLSTQGGAERIAAAEASLPVRRYFKVYLRHAADYPAVCTAFSALLSAGDEITYLRSDICRAELDIEIEASLSFGAL